MRAPELPPVAESRTLRAPSHFGVVDTLQRIAEAHPIDICSLKVKRRRFGLRDHILIEVAGDAMALAEFWRDVEAAVVDPGPGKIERAFKALVVWTDLTD